MKARISGVVKDSIVDGPGLRHAVFFQGCPHRCEGCHNSETWDPRKGVVMDVEDIARDAIEDPLCAGITLTGGDPLFQPIQAEQIAKLCKEAGKSVWLYTGYRFEDMCHLPVFWYVDVCVDGPFVEDLKRYDLKWRGSSNQRILNIEKWLETGELEKWNDSY